MGPLHPQIPPAADEIQYFPSVLAVRGWALIVGNCSWEHERSFQWDLVDSTDGKSQLYLLKTPVGSGPAQLQPVLLFMVQRYRISGGSGAHHIFLSEESRALILGS